ncbi:hypothetical protein SSX86_016463 [Deinandra increscens subsp. villosa]|uniref:Major facilitator superfamily (MFS) profile domain-containing protein n=1 Tax=Deinandra increscens subsp. villosa TaxID=3103831 RepID=A0AAP0CY14_9ASTR
MGINSNRVEHYSGSGHPRHEHTETAPAPRAEEEKSARHQPLQSTLIDMGSRRDVEENTSESLLLTAADGSRLRRSNRTPSAATPALVFSTLVAVCGSFVYGAAVGFSSPAQTGMMEDLGLSLEEYSVFGSILTIGAMVGAIMSGKIADQLGQRWTMGLSQIFCLFGWLAILYSQAVSWLLDAGRLFIGYGIGVISYVVPVYIAEITPKNLRGAFTNVNQLMIAIGISVMWLVGIVIPWRKLALIGTIPCLLQVLGLFFIPESPRWLAKNAAEIREYTETLHQLSKTGVFDLFQPEYARSLIVGVGLMVLQQFGGVNAIAFYANSIFISAGFSSSIGSIALGIVQIPFTILGVLLMDVAGRRPLLMVSAAGTCLGCLFLGVSFLLQDLQEYKGLSPILALVGVLVFKGSFSLGMGGIPWVIMSEIFPMNIKSSAGSLVTVVNWFGSWVVTYFFNFLMKCSTEGTFFLFSGVCCLTILFVAKLVPETKGRTLEEIQASMNPLTESVT